MQHILDSQTNLNRDAFNCQTILSDLGLSNYKLSDYFRLGKFDTLPGSYLSIDNLGINSLGALDQDTTMHAVCSEAALVSIVTNVADIEFDLAQSVDGQKWIAKGWPASGDLFAGGVVTLEAQWFQWAPNVNRFLFPRGTILTSNAGATMKVGQQACFMFVKGAEPTADAHYQCIMTTWDYDYLFGRVTSQVGIGLAYINLDTFDVNVVATQSNDTTRFSDYNNRKEDVLFSCWFPYNAAAWPRQNQEGLPTFWPCAQFHGKRIKPLNIGAGIQPNYVQLIQP